MNLLIEEEILGRLAMVKKNQPEIPAELKPLLEYFEKQSLDALVNVLIKDLTNAFSQWSTRRRFSFSGLIGVLVEICHYS